MVIEALTYLRRYTNKNATYNDIIPLLSQLTFPMQPPGPRSQRSISSSSASVAVLPERAITGDTDLSLSNDENGYFEFGIDGFDVDWHVGNMFNLDLHLGIPSF